MLEVRLRFINKLQQPITALKKLLIAHTGLRSAAGHQRPPAAGYQRDSPKTKSIKNMKEKHLNIVERSKI